MGKHGKKHTEHHSVVKKRENWARVFEYYGGRKCMICGVVSEAPIYDLHHHDSSGKEHTPSNIMHHSWAKVKRELDKCVLVCSNCHRVIHHIERQRRK